MKGLLPKSIKGLGFTAAALVALVLGLSLLARVVPVQAGTGYTSPPQTDPPQGPENAACLLCHNQPGQIIDLPSGEPLPVTISPEVYGASAHGQENMSCVTCHQDITGYPHPPVAAQSLRQYKLDRQNICRDCHVEQFQLTADGVHAAAMAAGNPDAPVCTSCHNPHSQAPIRDEASQILPAERVRIPQTCATCHNEIYQKYAQSVHGSALLVDYNPDVPTCIDCHGVHTIADPTTAAFRLSSVEMCAKCHTDPAIMDKYGLSTQVLDTYVADFHGTTVTLFEKTHPDELTNKAVCYDCHGIHDILSVNDPQKGIQVKQNILVACQKCHPDATANFPDSWLSHYIPSPDRYPLVYYVQLFYKILIPTVIGAMALFVVADFRRRGMPPRNKPGEPQAGSAAPEEAKSEPPAESESNATTGEE